MARLVPPRDVVSTCRHHQRAQKPVGLGIIGPGATRKQAEVRKDSSARATVRAAVRSLAALSEIR